MPNRNNHWCGWCGRKKVRYISLVGRKSIPKFKCSACNMTFVCLKKDLDKTPPQEVLKEIIKDDK